MSQQIDVARVIQFKNNVTALYQQSGSKLKGKVREESLVGKQHFFERLGATAAVKRTTRHADTPQVDSPHSRRMVTASDFEWADLIDQQDKIKMLIDPTSDYAINAAKSLGRAYDDEVIAAFDGSAFSGETGGTTVAFGADGTADANFSGAALTIANLLTLKKELDDEDVDDEGRYIVVSPAMLHQWLRKTEVASADFNSIKALVKGELNSFMGFEWIRSTRLPVPSGTLRYGFAWHKDSMGIAVGKDITTRIDERADKSYATQVYACMTMGATRVQGAGVVRFKVDEAL